MPLPLEELNRYKARPVSGSSRILATRRPHRVKDTRITVTRSRASTRTSSAVRVARGSDHTTRRSSGSDVGLPVNDHIECSTRSMRVRLLRAHARNWHSFGYEIDGRGEGRRPRKETSSALRARPALGIVPKFPLKRRPLVLRHIMVSIGRTGAPPRLRSSSRCSSVLYRGLATLQTKTRSSKDARGRHGDRSQGGRRDSEVVGPVVMRKRGAQVEVPTRAHLRQPLVRLEGEANHHCVNVDCPPAGAAHALCGRARWIEGLERNVRQLSTPACPTGRHLLTHG